MAYISKRDAPVITNGPVSKNEKKDTNQKSWADSTDDDFDDDLDEDDDFEEEDDKTFRKSLNTEFPLSGGETDEDE